MSYPTIPNITPNISVTLEDSVNMLLASIAMEEIALSHIMNAEGEKIQFALGTLFHNNNPSHCLSDIMAVNKDVRTTLTNVIRTEIVLQLKLDAIIDLVHTIPSYSCHHPHRHPHHHDDHHNHNHCDNNQHKCKCHPSPKHANLCPPSKHFCCACSSQCSCDDDIDE